MRERFSSVLVAVVILFSPLYSFSRVGPGGTGGGSGINAEIQRATDAFISVVAASPDLFPDVDPHKLVNVRARITVTAKQIESCDHNAILEAYSDRDQNKSVFNLSAWVAKSWIEKVLLAGHERLVLTGYERSNRYNLSNRIYDIQPSAMAEKTGTAPDICDFGEFWCKFKSNADLMIAKLASDVSKGTLTTESAKALLKMQENSITGQIDSLVAIKAIEIEKSPFSFLGNPQSELKAYENKVRFAFESHFRPIFKEAQKAVKGLSPDVTCIELK